MYSFNPWFSTKRLRHIAIALILLAVVGFSSNAQTSNAGLKLETWRTDDDARWTSQVLSAFTKAHSTKVNTKPTQAAIYDKVLLDKLSQNSAGDLISCRPFDRSVDLYNKGHLVDITSMPELRRFRSHNKIAWTTYYAERVFCMPVAAVMSGFFYNQQIFKALDIRPPKTEEELFVVLEKIKASGKYAPLAFGTKDSWQSTQVLFAGIGPNHWEGEQGRLNLLTGKAKFTDSPYVETWQALAKLADYLPQNHKKIGEKEARNMFLNGQAAIYPAGSWEIQFLSEHPNAKHFDVFAPPPKQNQHNCYVLSHFDMGIGINTKSAQQQEATSFLAWLSTPEFSRALVNSVHGFFPLSNHPVEINNPLAREMMSWRQQCDTTIRINSQFLSDAWPQLETELWQTTTKVMQKEISPEEAAKHISNGVEKWFKPI